MRIPSATCLAVYLVFVASFARAELTGNNLLSLCEENETACHAYVRGYTLGLQRGVIRGLLWEDPIAAATDVSDSADQVVGFCPPEGVTTGQMTDVLVKFLEDNPERRHEEIDILTFDAFRNAFGCSK